MASKTYEYQCPQFCDFTSEVNSSPKGAEFGGFSPELGNAAPILNVRAKCFKPPVIKRTAPAQQTPVDHSPNTTDSHKWCIAKARLTKRFSKSDGSVNLCSRYLQPSTYDSSDFFQQNRSLSENDIRPKTKKFPTTPICLKRTIYRAKLRKLKTSEELELEKIAELQKQMHEHLRANEIAMRRLKIKMKPCTAQREWTKTDMGSKDNFPIPKDHKIIGKLNGFRQNTRVSGTQERIDPRGIFTTKTEKAKRIANYLSQLQKSTSRRLSGNDQDPKSEADGLSLIKDKLPKPYIAHSGLAFLTNNQKITTVKPFNFNSKAKETGLASSSRVEKEISIKNQIRMQLPRACSKLAGKENNSSQSSFSDVKKAQHSKRRTPFHI